MHTELRVSTLVLFILAGLTTASDKANAVNSGQHMELHYLKALRMTWNCFHLTGDEASVLEKVEEDTA